MGKGVALEFKAAGLTTSRHTRGCVTDTHDVVRIFPLGRTNVESVATFNMRTHCERLREREPSMVKWMSAFE